MGENTDTHFSESALLKERKTTNIQRAHRSEGAVSVESRRHRQVYVRRRHEWRVHRVGAAAAAAAVQVGVAAAAVTAAVGVMPPPHHRRQYLERLVGVELHLGEAPEEEHLDEEEEVLVLRAEGARHGDLGALPVGLGEESALTVCPTGGGLDAVAVKPLREGLPEGNAFMQRGLS